MTQIQESDQDRRAQSIMLAPKSLRREFGKVYVRQRGETIDVEFTLWLTHLPSALAEGWRTAVALDGSASMMNSYGLGVRDETTLPAQLMAEYEEKGWLKTVIEDNRRVRTLNKFGRKDLRKRKLQIDLTENLVEPWARKFVAYLARDLDSLGRTTLMYWGCGNGREYEVLGELSEQDCEDLAIRGPVEHTLGIHTELTPALKYLVEKFEDARLFCVFLTDGRLEDMDSLVEYTKQLARSIDAGKRNFLKCVLVAVGNDIDRDQLEMLDNLDTGTSIDMWDYKIATDMRELGEILVELLDNKLVVDCPATIRDSFGTVVKRFTDGLPPRVTFEMPATSRHFTLEVGTHQIEQPVLMEMEA